MGSHGFAGLTATLEREGFTAFLAAFAPHATRRDRWAREATRLTGPLRSLVELFLLGQPVPLADLPTEVADALPALVDAGAAEVDGRSASLPALSLFRPYGVWLLAEPPGPSSVNTYFGPDSLALAMHATYRRGAMCLDLCAGPGFQGLVAVSRCATATLVELTAKAAGVAVLNAALNAVDDRVEVRTGDLYEPVHGNRYDHVVANVPFVPVPPGRPFPVAGAGGADGFELARRVFAGLPAHLCDGGSAHLATMLLRGPAGLLIADELADWAKRSECDLTITLTSRIPTTPDSPLVRGTADAIAAAAPATCADAGPGAEGSTVAQLADEVATHYADLGATSATWAFLRVDQGGGQLRVVDLGGSGRRAPWVSLV